ncbi:MAG: sigma-70 family RNA polymerase sigma factor [Alphaproteobacteria bacterium]|nr:sigma-70 family RNA polymerase sigma factor [Alphaproteobacteria bacterium]
MKHLIEQNKKYVKAIIRKFTGNCNEDLEQEVYIKTWQNLPEYKEEGKFKQWICTLTANVCKDYFRSKTYKRLSKQIDDSALESLTAGGTPERLISDKERQKIILKAVDSLSKEHKKVILLFEFEGYSIEDISLRLKIPVGTVKSRLFNARNILKEKLKFLQGEIR